MKSLKTKYGLIVFILLLLVLSTLLGVLFTQGRYEKEVLSSSDIYDGEMEYIVAEQVEVNSVEELIAAIENGYSNIKIADGVDNPLIITSGVTDVGTDLILDLNGHEIQRNNREPMLNIQNGVRLTIIDTSVEQSGSFYNPVGSVLRIGGGTLTVSAGAFVSGPKKSEYAEESGGDWSADRENGGGTIGGTTAAVTLYVKDESGENYEGSAANMPVITPHVEEATYSAGETQQYWFVNGNMYFDTDPAFGADAYGGKIEGDTYLYYVLDDDSVSTTTIAAEGSADFRYSYKVQRTENAETGAPVYTYISDEDAEALPDTEKENLFTVTVYGYNDVKASATASAHYATVEMLSGNMYVRGGSYTTNFGEKTAYGVYAEGGYMSVESGTFEAIEGGVCIHCDYAENSDEEYLRIADGAFGSEDGDTVQVSGGRVLVTGGAFTKTAASAGADSAAIRITGENSSITGDASSLTFTLEGSSVYGVYAEGGSVSLAGAAFTLSGSNSYGVYADGGDVTLTDAELSFGEGSGNYGVYADGGTVTLTNAQLSFGAGSSNRGVYADGGTVSLTKCDITLYGSSSSATDRTGNFGVYSEGTVSLNGTCTITVQGTYSSCVYASGAGSSITYTAASSADSLTVTMQMKAAAGDYVLSSTAISAVGGSVGLTGNVTVASDGLGVTTSSSTTGTVGTGGGSFTYAPTTEAAGSGDTPAERLSITTTRGTAMYINGDATLSGTVNITSAIAGEGYTVAGGAGIFDGVRVQSGSLDATNAVFNVTHTGVANDTYSGYRNYVVKSYAVRVMGDAETQVTTITKGTITNSVGGGVYVSNGDVTLGERIAGGAGEAAVSAANGALTVMTTGTALETDASGNAVWLSDTGVAEGNWSYRRSTTGGHAVEVEGGTLFAESGTFVSAQGNGILVQNGEAYVYNGYFVGGDTYKYTYPDGPVSPISGAGASYAFKLFGGSVTVLGGTFTDLASAGYGDDYIGSSAFVMGTGSTQATANIYGGTFTVEGQSGFSVFQNVSVTFTPNAPANGRTGSDIEVSAMSVGIAIEYQAQQNGNTVVTDVSVTVNGGSYASTAGEDNRDGIWYGNPNAKLNISGGIFTGSARSGLYFEYAPAASGNVQISGGTFIGQEANRSYATGSAVHYWSDGGAVGAMTATGSWGNYTGLRISVNNVLRSGCSFYNASGSRLNYEYIHTYNGLWNYSSLAEETQVSVRRA